MFAASSNWRVSQTCSLGSSECECGQRDLCANNLWHSALWISLSLAVGAALPWQGKAWDIASPVDHFFGHGDLLIQVGLP
jgi:hypothetical protein